MVWSGKKPATLSAVTSKIQTNDEFSATALPAQWEWNYQPRNEKWSLSEHPGYLRLYAFQPIDPNDNHRIIFRAGNTLTQRSMRTTHNEVTAKFEIGHMVDGQFAGLTHYAATFSTFGIKQTNGIRTLVYDNNGTVHAGIQIKGNVIWLKSAWDVIGKNRYSYSTDGKTFIPFGTTYQLTWGDYRGDRIGIFNFNTKGDLGFVDVDWFRYDYTKQ